MIEFKREIKSKKKSTTEELNSSRSSIPMDSRLNQKPLDDQNDLLMGLLLSKNSPGSDLLRNCDLPPPLKLFSPTTDESLRSPDNRVELLRALRLSQTRAREAEIKRAEITRDKDRLSAAIVEEAMKVFGYRQLLKLMDFEVNRLRSGSPAAEEDGDGGGLPTLIVAVAFCLGIGLVVGYGYRFFF